MASVASDTSSSDNNTTASGDVCFNLSPKDENASEDEELQAPPSKRQRGKAKEYEFIGAFETLDEAIERMNADNTKWTRKNWYHVENGTKFLFGCSTTTGSTCPCTAYVYLVAKTGKHSLFVSETLHQHNAIKQRTHGIAPKTKLEINKLCEIGIEKPRDIMKSLARNNLPVPTSQQVASFLASGKRKSRAKTINIDTLQHLNNQHTTILASAPDQQVSSQSRKRGRPAKQT